MNFWRIIRAIGFAHRNCTNFEHDFGTLDQLSERGVPAVQVLGSRPAKADKDLATVRIWVGTSGNGDHAEVVREGAVFKRVSPARSATPGPRRVATLDHERRTVRTLGNHTVKDGVVVQAAFNEASHVESRIRGRIWAEPKLHLSEARFDNQVSILIGAIPREFLIFVRHELDCFSIRRESGNLWARHRLQDKRSVGWLAVRNQLNVFDSVRLARPEFWEQLGKVLCAGRCDLGRDRCGFAGIPKLKFNAFGAQGRAYLDLKGPVDAVVKLTWNDVCRGKDREQQKG